MRDDFFDSDDIIITGISSVPQGKLIIQKSDAIIGISRLDLPLEELKILDLYLARINTTSPDKRTVVFKKRELEEILGVTKINNEALIQRLKHLQSQVFELTTLEGKRINLNLFSGSAFDPKTKEVTLRCTDDIMPFFFELGKRHYIKYRFLDIARFKSKSTYLMFIFLTRHKFIKNWTTPLAELRIELGASEDATYQDYKEFRRRILDKAKAEIEEKTNLKFSYKANTDNYHTVVSIRFTIDEDIPMPVISSEDGKEIIDEPIRMVDPLTRPFIEKICKYISERRDIGTWSISPLDLWIECDGEDDEFVDNYESLDKKILKECKKLMEETIFAFRYEGVQGSFGQIVAIRFTMKSCVTTDKEKNLYNLSKAERSAIIDKRRDSWVKFMNNWEEDDEYRNNVYTLAEEVDFEFSPTLLRPIIAAIAEKSIDDLPGEDDYYIKDDLWARRGRFLRKMYTKLCAASEKTLIVDRHSYLLQIIRNNKT